MNKNKRIIKVYSKKMKKCLTFNLDDEKLRKENYECVGCSNADYGS